MFGKLYSYIAFDNFCKILFIRCFYRHFTKQKTYKLYNTVFNYYYNNTYNNKVIKKVLKHNYNKGHYKVPFIFLFLCMQA